MQIPSTEDNFQDLYLNTPKIFFDNLRCDLTRHQTTSTITLLDIYRIRNTTLPMLDIWITSQNNIYESILIGRENSVLHALRYEKSLSDTTALINESRNTFNRVFKKLVNTLPKRTAI